MAFLYRNNVFLYLIFFGNLYKDVHSLTLCYWSLPRLNQGQLREQGEGLRLPSFHIQMIIFCPNKARWLEKSKAALPGPIFASACIGVKLLYLRRQNEIITCLTFRQVEELHNILALKRIT